MFDLILIVILIAGIGYIVYLYVKKTDKLSALDAKSAHQMRQEMTKQDIITQRLERKFTYFGSILLKIFRPLGKYLFNLVKELYKKITHLEWQYRQRSNVQTNGDKKQNIPSSFNILHEVDELIENKDYSTAEKKLIELVSLEPKNLEIYRKLGELYMENKDYQHAYETFHYIVDSDKKSQEEQEIIDGSTNAQLASDYINLGLALRELDKMDEAIEIIDKACKLESNNPRNLDILLETSIMAKNKLLAWQAFDRLKQVNPENNKLAEFEEKIKQLEQETKAI